jgi:hypothetical protein
MAASARGRRQSTSSATTATLVVRADLPEGVDARRIKASAATASSE